MTINKHYKDVKKGLKKEFHPNTFTYSKYRLSPYNACEHGCIYCDGRAEKYFVLGDFQKDIVIKKNLPDLLEKEIPLLREISPISIGSGITDVYQPVEEQECLMRDILKVILNSDLPVNILTKSSLILRDKDLLERIAKKNGFTLFISLNSLDDKIIKKSEPNASSIESRLNLISEFKKIGANVGILCMPILPFLTDKKDLLEQLIVEVKKRGADFIMPGCLTLRPGKQKKFYLDSIKNNFTNFYNSYLDLYANEASSGIPLTSYTSHLYRNFSSILNKHNTPYLLPHSKFKNYFPVYDEIFLVLTQMMEIYKYSNIDISRLNKAFKLYKSWLEAEKKRFNKKRSLNCSYISDILKFKLKTGEFSKIIENEKLYNFIKEMVFENKYFDPSLKKLIPLD